MELTRLIEALSDTAAYPHPADAVEVRQTHISAVFLAGPIAYKVKKPVVLPFLDFSTLESRRHFCEEEVRLNRRLAPEVYFGVVPITATPAGARFEGDGEPVEWAVKMRRLPEGADLRSRLRNEGVTVGVVKALARRVAEFHRTAESGPRVAAYARFEPVAGAINDVLRQAASVVGRAIHPDVFARLTQLVDDALRRLRPVIEGRADRGVPRDGHGDLRLDHVYHFPDRDPPGDLVVIDCVEFSERLRCTDPVADMAFLVMDLAFHGRRDLAVAFADDYFSHSEDPKSRVLLPLYTAYRAAVRGAVDGILLGEREVPDEQRRAALERARGRWLLALGELEEPGRRPCLVLVGGLPGAGKSTLARALAERGDFRVIRSDVVRKELAGGSVQGLYSPEWDERTYAECLRRAEESLFEGKRVIVDATFRQEAKRRLFLDAAVRRGVPGVLLLCRAGPETTRLRLANRHGDASDADSWVYSRLAAAWEESGSATRRDVHLLATDGSPDEALAQAPGVLRQLGVQA
jgi:aminoglycoside phosphotransferase family enzyme/predicted kinase